MNNLKKHQSSAEIRQHFVDYFKRHGHQPVQSSSLIPDNDPTLLFTNAGMNQFKNLFLGLEKRDYNRAVSVQKCVRAGGKHNDLENVGFTARHHTFFEMLGNFSFGDYFKKDAIHFAWELLTKDLGIPKEKLYVTVFQTDDEAAEIWHNQEGVPRDRIFRFGEKDNFWRMGDTGPCGPCSEIFYDHGPGAGKETDPYKGIVSGEDRFVEIWNLVFMQFFEKAPGVMEPLPKPSVDTGSGLERVVAALQGYTNNYDTDLFQQMIGRACDLSGVKYKAQADSTSALRVLADHTRSASFLLADGALPSNEGRGYVLRRILRRAIRYGRKLTDKHSLLPVMADVMIEQMGGFYPELKVRKEHILSSLKDEESRFLATLDQGTAILNEELTRLRTANSKELSGDVIFKLYDTFGFPVDLTRLMANEHGFSVDEVKFEQQMQSAREKAKGSWKAKGPSSNENHLVSLCQEVATKNGETIFTGYEQLKTNAKILSLSNGENKVQTLKSGESGILICTATPFYAEGGGQAGDVGTISNNHFKASVLSTTKINGIFLHHIRIEQGSAETSQAIDMTVTSNIRRQTMSNHSATHLLQAALRNVLGNHVTQAGSQVDSNRLRFDFTHNKPLSEADVIAVENLVNMQISNTLKVTPATMSYKEALKTGAMALFGEKYGDNVRVLTMGDFSTELCGGTHVGNTSEIRVFKITSESGVSSGVRRIEAISGDSAVAFLQSSQEETQKARAAANIQSNQSLTDWIEAKKSEIKNLERQLRQTQGDQINIDEICKNAKTFQAKGLAAKLVTIELQFDDRELLAKINDQIKNKIQTGVVVVLGKGSDSHPMIVSVTKDLNPGISAGGILKDLAAILGGKGGGRPDFAQGAVPNRDQFKEAFEKAEVLLGVKS